MSDPDAGNSRQLSTAQRAALDVLLTGGTRAQAALAADRTERTLRRWLAEEDAFRDALETAGEEALAGATTRLKLLLDAAQNAIYQVLTDADASSKDKLRAAYLVHQFVQRLVEFEELRAEVEEIKERLNSVGSK